MFYVLCKRSSLVQIKSHAQKVLKRVDQGENVFRRLEESMSRAELLVHGLKREQDSTGVLGDETLLPTKHHSRSSHHLNNNNNNNINVFKQHQSPAPRSDAGAEVATTTKTTNLLADNNMAHHQHIFAASALCQLAAPTTAWDTTTTSLTRSRV
jgi:hypothetical protein